MQNTASQPHSAAEAGIPSTPSGSCFRCGATHSENIWHGKSTCDKCFAELIAEDKAFLAEAASSHSHKTAEDVFTDLCPPEYRKPVNYELLDADAFQSVETWPYGERGLIINGRSGTGKTRAVWALLRRLFLKEGRSFRFFDGYDFSTSAADAARGGRERVWMHELVAADVFVFDDLGKGKMTPNSESSLFACIDKRQAAMKPVILTTQHNSGSMAELFLDGKTGEAVIRRLRDTCGSIHFGPKR